MSSLIFSPEQVAERLGLHVRTVRNYVRTGQLKAVRIGKQYRIAAEDLDTMTGRSKSAAELETGQKQHRIEVSSIVEIDAVSPDTAQRVATFITSAANARGQDLEALHIETIYDSERNRMKIILVSGMDTSAWMFKLIHAALEL